MSLTSGEKRGAWWMLLLRRNDHSRWLPARHPAPATPVFQVCSGAPTAIIAPWCCLELLFRRKLTGVGEAGQQAGRIGGWGARSYCIFEWQGAEKERKRGEIAMCASSRRGEMGRWADGDAARVHKDRSAWEARSRLWRFRRRIQPPIRATEHMSGATSTSLSPTPFPLAWTLPVGICGCTIALYSSRQDQHAMSYPSHLCNIARNGLTTTNTIHPPETPAPFASAIAILKRAPIDLR